MSSDLRNDHATVKVAAELEARRLAMWRIAYAEYDAPLRVAVPPAPEPIGDKDSA